MPSAAIPGAAEPEPVLGPERDQRRRAGEERNPPTGKAVDRRAAGRRRIVRSSGQRERSGGRAEEPFRRADVRAQRQLGLGCAREAAQRADRRGRQREHQQHQCEQRRRPAGQFLEGRQQHRPHHSELDQHRDEPERAERLDPLRLLDRPVGVEPEPLQVRG